MSLERPLRFELGDVVHQKRGDLITHLVMFATDREWDSACEGVYNNIQPTHIYDLEHGKYNDPDLFKAEDGVVTCLRCIAYKHEIDCGERIYRLKESL